MNGEYTVALTPTSSTHRDQAHTPRYLQLAADGDAFMPYEFQKTIIGNPHYDPAAPKPYFWPSFFYLNKEMLRANAGITQRHPWESVWWEWIFNLRGILYYSYDKQLTYTQGIYLLGALMPLGVRLQFEVEYRAYFSILQCCDARLCTETVRHCSI